MVNRGIQDISASVAAAIVMTIIVMAVYIYYKWTRRF